MRSGKHKSKENTWTEKDLTEALQGEKPRHSKDDSRRRESREDGSQKRHSKERSHEEREKDRQRTKHEKSERRHEEASLDPGEGSSRRSKGTKDDRERERKHRDKSRGKLKDDDDNENSSGDRMKERRRRERNRDEGKDERRKERNKDESSHRERDESSRDKERSRNSKEDPERERERRRESHDREKEANRREKDKERRREKGERGRDKDEGRKGKEEDEGRSGKEKDERRKDKEKDERRRDKEKEERRRDREKEEGRGKEKDERRRDKGKDERRSDKEKEEGRRDRDKDERKREKEKSERKRDKEKEEETGSSDRRKDDDHEREREKRRRRKEEESKERERSKKETESNDKDERRKEKRDKERSEEDKEDRRRQREDREKRKQKEHGEKSGEKESESRRHEEGKETEYEDDTRKKSKGKLELSSRSSSLHKEAEIDEEIANEDNYDEDNYEDDFEDYEDDFEDADEEDDDDNIESEHEKGKLLEIFEAINAENDDVRRSPFQQTTTQDSREEEVKTVHKPAKSSSEGRINFFAAKQKHVNEFVASKTRKRAQELHNLIELDVASYDIFDLPPLNEYELYIKSYGQSDSKQAYVQCHDDIVEKEMQTEDIETSTKWTQYPPDDFRGCGEGDESVDKDDLNLSPHSVDSVKLSNFLQQAGQVCLILLEEKISGNADSMFKERNDIDISDGFIQLATKLPFIEGRRILDMNFNSIQTHLLLTAHDSDSSQPSVSGNDFLRGKGIVCFWNVNEPTQPQKILFCESSPMCCCFSPVKSSLVFAGLDDGSIVIWDVRESSSLHSTVEYKENQWVVRRPTFSTAGVFSNENHLSPVLNILPISFTKESAQASLRTSFVQDEPGGMAFQLASLEENGVVNIWVVIELEKPDEAGSESDLGLAPGGRVKLIKSTSIKVESPYREVFSSSFLQTSVMQFSTEDSNHFYVGTDRGWVVHCTRYGGRTQPKAYRSEIDAFVAVTAIDVSPWSIPIMLVGCADGTLRLHDLRKEFMIRSWSETTQGNPIVQVKWSRSRPSLFYVLDAKSNLYIWDLQQKSDCPVTTEYFKRGKLLSFSISNDYESLGIGLPGRKSELVLNYEGGIIELHRLKPTLTNVQADELDRFSSLVDSFI